MSLEKHYDTWSDKSERGIRSDIQSAIRKAEAIAYGISNNKSLRMERILDFGCGYGTVVDFLCKKFQAETGYGFDFSRSAIDYAKKNYGNDKLFFHRLETLNTAESIETIKSIILDEVDCILLIDVLEHIPDCKRLILGLSKLTKFFIIKLPIESSVFDNLIFPKEYPGTTHSNGHLREFNLNTVYYFIRELGLTPLYETTYKYHIDDICPPPERWTSKKHIIAYHVIRLFKRISSYLLPKRLFLSVIGGGGYYCLATFNEDHMLNP